MVRLFAQGERQLKKRLKELGLDGNLRASDVAFFEATSLDPQFVAAWARLINSSNKKVAFSAVDTWAKLEPENALPYYAKASLLSGPIGNRWTEPYSKSILAALREGNQRPSCRVPEIPWPKDFNIRLDDDGTPTKEDSGTPMKPYTLRVAVESHFETIEMLNQRRLSASTLRDIADAITRNGPGLPPQIEVELLAQFCGMNLQMLRSNRWQLALSGVNRRAFRRLENIAIDHADFGSARQVVRLQMDVRRVLRTVADEYFKAEEESGLDAESRAQRVMEKEQARLDLTRPTVKLSDQNPEKRAIVVAHESAFPTDWLALDVFESADGYEMVIQAGQVPPDRPLKHDELKKTGFVELDDRIGEIRKQNREQERQAGLMLKVDRRIFPDVYMSCESWGYSTKRDAAMLCFSDATDFELFHQWIPNCKIRTVLRLEDGSLLNREDLKQMSLRADYIIVPLNRLVRDGKRSPLLEETRLHWMVSGKDREALQRFVDANERVEGLVLQ